MYIENDAQYEKNYYLRTSDFDCRGKLLPSAVLDLFQDAAGSHADKMGIGHDDMIKQDIVWVLTKVKFKVFADAKMHRSVKVKTWPVKPGILSFNREYLVEDENGDVLIKGTSEWVFMHVLRRKVVAVGDVYPFDEGFVQERAFEEKLSKIHDFEAESESFPFVAGFSQLDINGHVNNTKYANYALDALDLMEDEIIDVFQLDFRKEITRGEKMTVGYRKCDKDILLKGQNADGVNMFLCKIELK